MSRGPGRWQRALLNALEERGAVPVAWYFAEQYGRSLEDAEYKAIQRAADALVKSGRAEWHQVWARNWAGRRSLEKWIFRKGTGPKDYGLPEGKGALNRRRGEKRPTLRNELSVECAAGASQSADSTLNEINQTAPAVPARRKFEYLRKDEKTLCPRCGYGAHPFSVFGVEQGERKQEIWVCPGCIADLVNEWVAVNEPVAGHWAEPAKD